MSSKKNNKCQAFCNDRFTGDKWKCGQNSVHVSNVKVNGEPIKVCNAHKFIYCEHTEQAQRYFQAERYFCSPEGRWKTLKLEVTAKACQCGHINKILRVVEDERVHNAQWTEKCNSMATVMVGNKCLCAKHSKC